MFDQICRPVGLGEKVPDALRAVVVEQGRQVEEQFVDLCHIDGPGCMEVLRSRVTDTPNDACELGLADGVVFRRLCAT